MAKNIRIEVFMDFAQLGEIHKAAEERKIVYKTESDLIRKELKDYCTKFDEIVNTFDALKARFESRGEKIDQLNKNIEFFQSEIAKKDNEIGILKNNLEVMKNEKHKKG